MDSPEVELLSAALRDAHTWLVVGNHHKASETLRRGLVQYDDCIATSDDHALLKSIFKAMKESALRCEKRAQQP